MSLTARSERLALRHHVAVMRAARLPDWLHDAAGHADLVASLIPRADRLVAGGRSLRRVRLDDARAGRRVWTLRYLIDVETDQGSRAVAVTVDRLPSGAAASGCHVTPRDACALSDPVQAKALLERALRPGHPDLSVIAIESRLARHKPGNRATHVHTLRYPQASDPTWPRRVVTKTYRDAAQGAATYAVMGALWQARHEFAPEPVVAEPLAYLEADRVLVQAVIPGDRTLAELLTDPRVADMRRTAMLRRTAAALAAMHGSSVSTGLRHDVPAQLAAIHRMLVRVAPSLPTDAVRATEALLAGLAREGERHPAPTPGPVHGAFRPAQVLLDGGRPGFVDFDSAGVGEAAVDIGRFVARLAEPAHLPGAVEAFVDGYPGRTRPPASRVALWQCLELTSTVVRGWARARPDRAAASVDLLDRAVGTID